ncbi:aldehyde dehydrogenase family protein, partial [Streptomyces sp. NPDC004561]
MAPTLAPEPPTTPEPAPSVLKPGTSYVDAWRRCVAVAPEAFRDDRVLNLWGAAWRPDGRALPATTPVDGTPIAGAPRLDGATAQQAVHAALDQHRAWRQLPLPERRPRIGATLDALAQHRDLLALLLVCLSSVTWWVVKTASTRSPGNARRAASTTR